MEETPQETPMTEEKPLSLVEEAKAIRDEIVKAKEELKAENDRKEKINAEEMLGGSTGGHLPEEKPKEESPEEYAKKLLENNL